MQGEFEPVVFHCQHSLLPHVLVAAGYNVLIILQFSGKWIDSSSSMIVVRHIAIPIPRTTTGVLFDNLLQRVVVSFGVVTVRKQLVTDS